MCLLKCCRRGVLQSDQQTVCTHDILHTHRKKKQNSVRNTDDGSNGGGERLVRSNRKKYERSKWTLDEWKKTVREIKRERKRKRKNGAKNETKQRTN